MAGNDLAVAALAASPALGAIQPPPQAKPTASTAGAFADTLQSAIQSAVPQSTSQVSVSRGDGSFGLGRALGVIAALRDQTSPAAAAAPSLAAVPGQPIGAAVPAGATASTGDAGAKRVALAAAELGVTEAPSGSNDGPRIAEYRTAVPGGPVGRWCAYFVSWVAKQAGTPLGENGQGFAAVQGVRSWLRGSGRLAEGPAAVGRPGDLVFFDGNRDGVWDHIGLVESVLPDGSVRTIEGNSSDAVRRRVRERSDIVAFGTLP
jgi:cell wall-associated NlpC family hydrolase